ncbi:recombinase family protein [Flagellimonas onchidii]|uniref:recombinase family protein n=1 Tax=Flagellimonas onchidii TaxID=2562684 RepID=UPI0010A6AC1C|nr:recombinase family protein [Allomuricauda onchidii]
MKKAKYIRVSTTEQSTERQKENGFKLFIDKVSGSVPFNERKAASKLLIEADKGDLSEVHVHAIDRLGRNTLDILETIKTLTEKGVNVVSQKEGFCTLVDGKENPTAKLVISIMATLAEYELNLIKERQREGIQRAKERGVYTANGGSNPLTDEQFLSKAKNALCAKHLRAGESIRRAAKLSGVSNATSQKVKRIMNSVKNVSVL